MEWQDSPEQAAFRSEVRSFIEQRLPKHYRARPPGAPDEWVADRKAAEPARRNAAREWADALGERGWVAPHIPTEYGGGGLSKWEQFIYNQEMARVSAPVVGSSHSVEMLTPTLVVHGTDAQKSAYLPRILAGEMVWCQGYSEPGAGSDLASVQTRAVLDGDEYVVNGQKIWTTNGHQADAIFAMVRTDPDAPKHRGISFLLIDDMTIEGVSVRPLVNMAWEHGFNEVFFEDVRVPAANVVGDVNRGWYVSMTLLDFERSGVRQATNVRRQFNQLLDEVREPRVPGSVRDLPSIRAEIADRAIDTAVCENFSLRVISMQAAGLIPNYEASMGKLRISETLQAISRTGVRTFGLYSNLWDPADERSPARADFTQRYLTTIPHTIGAGTSEVQRNIIATRGLGLPRG